jgi:hypothetical protein
VFESCCSPHDAAHLLRHRYGLPVELIGHRPAVVCGSRISAVDLPATLGCHVIGLLGDQPSLPVVANPRDAVWTFLVTPPWPPTPPSTHSPQRLADAGVIVRLRGQRVMLPVSDTGHGWRWASEPSSAGALRLPTRSSVLEATELALELITAT